jgi:hypothetical protein
MVCNAQVTLMNIQILKRRRSVKMAKEIILYNLAPQVTDEQYLDYVKKEKGPLMESFPSVKKFELVKITGAASGNTPYQYIGIVHLNNSRDFLQEDVPSAKFQEFLKKWRAMVADVHILVGEEIY